MEIWPHQHPNYFIVVYVREQDRLYFDITLKGVFDNYTGGYIFKNERKEEIKDKMKNMMEQYIENYKEYITTLEKSIEKLKE